MQRRFLLPVATGLLALCGSMTWAQTTAPATTAATTAATASPLIEAEVRKVDAAAGKVTLKHGDIPHLDMPGMTMVFQVRDKAQLDTIKAGDRVQFRADKILGAYVASDIVPSR
jgi:Cu(I)/Ag(I) efflux system periplasmic protein CusF